MTDQPSTTRSELDERMLAQARARSSGDLLRRVLLLLAAAFVLAVVGNQPGQSPLLGYAAAAVCIAVAVVLTIRGDRIGRSR